MKKENSTIKKESVFNSFLSRLIISTLIFLSVFFLYLISIHDYGETYDEAFYLSTGDIYLNIFRQKDWPVLSTISIELPSWAGTIGSYISRLPIFPGYPNTDRFHLIAIVSAALAVTVVFNFTKEITGSYLFALLGSLLLATFPQFFIQGHMNSRDMMLTGCYSLAVFLIYLFVKYRRIELLLIAGIVAGFTFDVKSNALFLIPIALMTFIFAVKEKRKVPLFFLIFVLLYALSLILFWPYLWFDFRNHFLTIVKYFSSFSRGETVFYDQVLYSHKNIPWFYPWAMLGILSPPPTLFLIFIGIMMFFRRILNGKREEIIIFLWAIVPLSRFFIPRSAFAYDQIRIFLEVLPVLPILAVVGIFFLFSSLKLGNIKPKLIKSAVLILCFFCVFYQIFLIVIYHPYETAYFNFLAGKPEYVNHAFDIEYWGHVYREAASLIRKRYPKETVFYFPSSFGYGLLRGAGFPYQITENLKDSFDYVVFMNRRSFWYNCPYLNWLVKNRKPLFTIERQGKTIFYLFAPAKEEYRRVGGQ